MEVIVNESIAFGVVVVLLVMLVKGYGSQLAGWILCRLYDIFIGMRTL